MTPSFFPPKTSRLSWRSKAFRGLACQAIALILVIALGAYLMHNVSQNMRVRGIHSGFDFLSQSAGFSIGESVVPFDSNDSYGKAFLVGLSNTLRVAIASVILATLLGTAIGIGKLSRNFLLRTLCSAYVQAFRNVPLLLQLFMWYFVMTELLPPVTSAIQPVAGLFLSKNGLQFPIPVWVNGQWMTLAGLLAGAIGAWFWTRQTKRHLYATGRLWPSFWPCVAIVMAAALVGWLLGGSPSAIDIPEQSELSITGGGAVTPEYLTMVIGLTIYNASFIAEIVRSGIQSVPFGQHEAAAALGLPPGREIRLIQMPQALRVIIPPLTSQYLNITKNASLAVAIGYPDLVSISNTSINQTGRAIECISLVMACYLTLSLLMAAFMNVYNKRAVIKER
ncbi:amino acid ABC transporter permease [Burkholderia sp. L27(2015)]|uniref:amino acid ABC transporter permease n=1 Tax=Burkholderia sp. L27(2015) TaxID=1641858 RepID=UPI00131B4DCC|nr:ABC transporter permease subunit [Burkholderia sp. L27(2015)]